MNKLCPECQHINAAHELLCSACRSDLTYACEVSSGARSVCDDTHPIGETASWETKAENTRAAACNCEFPQPDLDGVCICGLCVSPTSINSSSSVEQDDYRNTNQAFAAQNSGEPILSFEKNSTAAIGTGLVLGRLNNATPSHLHSVLSNAKGVSRLHLWLAHINDEVILLDCGSRNGTWCGSVRLIPYISHRLALTSLPKTIYLGGTCVAKLELGKAP